MNIELYKNGYNAASAISSLSDIEINSDVALAVSAMCEIVRVDIESVSVVHFRHDAELLQRVKHLIDLSFLVSHIGFRVGSDGMDAQAFDIVASDLFRCASDMRNDLNDQGRHDWSSNNHWRRAAEADKKYNELVQREDV